MQGYKKLLSYQLARVIFDLTWEFVPEFYFRIEDSRQRDQMKQAARSLKQNIVEGSEERSLSSKLKLLDVARSSLGELLEDYEDIQRYQNLPRWNKNDSRLVKLREVIEGYCPSGPSPSGTSGSPGSSSKATVGVILQAMGIRGTRGTRRTRWEEKKERPEELEIVVNYLIDLLVRCGYLLDRQLDAVERKHQLEGGYTEKLHRKRREYRGY